MKKVLALLLTLCMLIGLTACGAPIKVKKFESETEMQEYLNGAWSDYDGSYMIFFDGSQMYLDDDADHTHDFEDSLNTIVKEQGYESISAMDVKDYVAKLEKEWFDYATNTTCQFNPKKGTLTYTSDETEHTIYVGDGVICGLDGEDKMEKLSDTPSYTAAGLIEKFEDAYKNYKPKADDVMRSNEQYAEALIKLHPEIKNYPLAADKEDFHLYSDTGNADGDFDNGLMWSKNTVLYAKRSYSEDKYTLLLTKDSRLTITDTNHRETWETLAADMLALFGGAPGFPTPEELVKEFQEKGETKTYQGAINSTTVTEYETRIGGQTCKMTHHPDYKMISLEL